MDLKNFIKLVMEAVPKNTTVEFDIRISDFENEIFIDANGHNLKFTIGGKIKGDEL